MIPFRKVLPSLKKDKVVPMSEPASVRLPDPATLILTIRDQRVILDSDLATLYGSTTKRLNEQLRRNRERFPEDFVFQLTRQEFDILRSQFATSSPHGGRRYLPHAFTEHGAIMAANVLNSPRAITMSVEVVRAFVRLRRMALSVDELSRKVTALERKYDGQFKVVFDALRQLMAPLPDPPKPRIGFHGGD